MCTDGGLHRTVNGGANWVWKSKGIGVAHTRSIAGVRPDPETMFLASFHCGANKAINFIKQKTTRFGKTKLLNWKGGGNEYV